MTTKRYLQIDYIKAIAVTVVILIHTVDRYRSSGLSYYVWDYLHFVVGLFVFASGFLLQLKESKDGKPVLSWSFLVKRMKRLYNPYIAYLVIHFALFFTLPALFNKFEGDTIDLDYTIKTLFLYNGEGAGNNWIPRIFIQLTLMHILELYLGQIMRRDLRNMFYALAVGSSLLFLFIDLGELEGSLRFIPWYGVYCFGRSFYQLTSSKSGRYIPVLTLSILFIITHLVYTLLGYEPGMFNNKYPPTFIFIAYQALLSVIIYNLVDKSIRYIKDSTHFNRLIMFMSKESYMFFFMHIVAMDLIEDTGSFLIDFLLILFVTVLGTFIYSKVILSASELWKK